MTRSWRRSVAALAIAFTAGCGPPMASFRQHPEMIDELRTNGRVAMLPADVAVVELDLYGDNPRLTDVEDQLKTALEKNLTERFTRRGFELQPARLEETEIGDDPNIRFDLTRLQMDYGHLTHRLYRKNLDETGARSVRAAMSPLVNRFADRAQADVLLFTTLVGYIKSEGMQQKDGFFTLIGALLGSYQPAPVAAAALEIALINGTNGELLWIDRSGAVFYNEINARFLVDSSLEKFHGLYNAPKQDPPASTAPAAAPTEPDTPPDQQDTEAECND